MFSSKENTMLRGNLKSSKVSVIPNAVDALAFRPDIKLRPVSSDESKKIKINIKIINIIFFSSYYYCC